MSRSPSWAVLREERYTERVSTGGSTRHHQLRRRRHISTDTL